MQMQKLRYILLAIILTALTLMTSGCFQIIRQENQILPSNTTFTPISGLINKVVCLMSGANSGERFGSSVALIDNVDGVGHQGIAVGAMNASPYGKDGAGGVYIVSLANIQSLYRIDGQGAGDQFGRTLAVIGDLNDDKVPEFIVGAPAGDVEGLTDAGYVGLYSGKDGRRIGYYPGTMKNFRLGHSLAALGDINGDSIPDFALGTPFASQGEKEDIGAVIIELSQHQPLKYQPLNLYGESAEDKFGWAIASIGDVDGDQIADIAVGAPEVKSSGEVSVGRVYILSGNSGAILYKIDGTQPSERFGFSVAGIDDVNGDETADFIVGAPVVDLSEKTAPGLSGSFISGAGKAYVFSGRDGSLIFQLEGSPAGSSFGLCVASGDIDGDGLSDIIVGDPSTSQKAGSVQVFSGRDGKCLHVFSNNVNKKEEFGRAVSCANDLNGDGRDDIIVGAYSFTNIEGKPTGSVYVVHLP